MQPDDQQAHQEPPVTTDQGPVVTLTPEEGQATAQYSHAGDSPEAAAEFSPNEPVHWQASEYIHREKDHIWFVLFIIVTLSLIALAVFVIKSPSFAILIPVMAVTLFIYTRRPPRVLDYTLSRKGLYINDQLFAFSEFKSFALVHGLEQYSVMLVPVKRFKPAITANFPEEVGEVIVDMLAARLPMQEVQPDFVDRLIRKLHI